jgi:hypothetical protein
VLPVDRCPGCANFAHSVRASCSCCNAAALAATAVGSSGRSMAAVLHELVSTGLRCCCCLCCCRCYCSGFPHRCLCCCFKLQVQATATAPLPCSGALAAALLATALATATAALIEMDPGTPTAITSWLAYRLLPCSSMMGRQHTCALSNILAWSLLVEA